ncbi:YbaB/EbfC family nucleoid-associated protein [Nocardia neocaledoniensis]|uniref:YbaB/EbfC family nucleoid-associated protein n=1 Tax=Nocardia neocaledoniensis TaxID=236511 RepID=UPI002458F90A|nr:YbaB/EbfC family nucleoid-associated protein [Nocardia neocaledoniensis]
MSSTEDWDRELEEHLHDLRRSANEFSTALSRLRGHGTARGVAIEVDAKGDITSLQIAPSAMSRSPSQLSHALVEIHRRARSDIQTQTAKLLQTADPQLRLGIEELKGEPSQTSSIRPARLTEAEIQAADDAYFTRLNGEDW